MRECSGLQSVAKVSQFGKDFLKARILELHQHEHRTRTFPWVSCKTYP